MSRIIFFTSLNDYALMLNERMKKLHKSTRAAFEIEFVVEVFQTQKKRIIQVLFT
jgi:hypothetical protein